MEGSLGGGGGCSVGPPGSLTKRKKDRNRERKGGRQGRRERETNKQSSGMVDR